MRMDSRVGSRKSSQGQASAKSSRGARLYQLGQTAAMSPSMMSSSGPSLENAPAFAANDWGLGMHHSTSTPQMYPGGFEEKTGHPSTKYRSGPSTFGAATDPTAFGTPAASHPGPRKATTPNADFVRQTNLAHILEHSDGSPSRFLRSSPNPGMGNNTASGRASRPQNLGFGNIGEHLQANDQQAMGPKSAPAQVHTFDQAANYSNSGPWNKNVFDERWLHRAEEINPQDSIVSSAYPSSTHLELLTAQYGIKNSAEAGGRSMDNPNSQTQSRLSPALPSGQNLEASDVLSVGHGYDTLRAYAENAASGRARNVVPELEQLMSTMLYLRGEGDSLPSMQHFGRDALRQSMYRSVFGVDDGSSALSRENPFHYIDVAGQRITRKALHDEVTRFLEEQVNSMTATPDLSGQNQAPPSTQPFEDRNSANRNLDYGENEGGEQFERNDVGPVASWGAQQHSGMMPGVSLHATPLYGQPATNFQQQHYLSMLQQQQAAHQPGQFISQQFLPPHGMMLAPSYLAPQTQPLTFYPGRQTVPQVGQFNPYAPQFLPAHGMGMHQLGGPMMQPQLVPNYQPAMSGMMPPHVAPFAPGAMRPMQQYGPQWPQMPARVYAPSSRTSSPMPRAQSRGGRNVVSDVRVLPYRPGSDDMYPRQTVEGSSVRLQELQREGPSYNFATHPENLPFIETARHSRPAEWGVLKIGNIPYSLTKQEVLGFLGRNAKILTADIGVPIHIIMDRSNGKTMDCYVEFFSHGDVQATFNKCLLRGNQLRLGERVVDVCMSTQDELLKEMFPKAKNVEWSHGRPVIKDSNDPYNSGFKFFVTNEELLLLVSYAEKPHRSNYTQKCLQRPYESMISVLAKFPWFAVDRYTIKTRDEIFKQTLKLISLLTEQLRRGHEAYLPHLSESLLMELLYAGLNAPAFSEQQRWQLCQSAGTSGDRIRMSPLVPYWPFEVLGRKPGVDEDFVREYARYLQSHPRNTSTEGPFGTWTAESNEALGLTTIGQIGSHEMQMVLSMLRDVLPSGPPQP